MPASTLNQSLSVATATEAFSKTLALVIDSGISVGAEDSKSVGATYRVVKSQLPYAPRTIAVKMA